MELTPCRICPRRCGARRSQGQTGLCHAGANAIVARAAPHFGEEPCISGTRGSGTIFFCGCNLGCVFCQNAAISRGAGGKTLSQAQLRACMLRLRDQGVHNINLVTPTHFAIPIRQALHGAKLDIPVIWNSSGYDSPQTLRTLGGLVQIWMPDYKYALPDVAARYCHAPDYPEAARAALREMYQLAGPVRLDGDGLMQSGVLVRHLVLPGQLENSLRALEDIARTLPPDGILLSLMAQYTPMPGTEAFPELQHTVTQEQFSAVLERMEQLGFENGFYQDPDASGTDMIPEFDLTGVS